MSSETTPTKANMQSFKVLQTQANSAARQGTFAVSRTNANTISTPNFLLPTSRGSVPHLTPEILRKHVDVPALYIGVEDFIYKAAMKSPLTLSGFKIRDYVSIMPPLDSKSPQIPIFLSPRRSNPIPTSQPSTDNTLAVVTSDGFRQFPIQEYFQLVSQIKDDDTVVIAPTDLPLMLVPNGARGSGVAVRSSTKVGGNRSRKLVVRNEKWSTSMLEKFSKDVPVIVPLIPGISFSQQQMYFDSLLGKENVFVAAKTIETIDGLAVSDLTSPFLPEPEAEEEEDLDRLGQKENIAPENDTSLTSASTVDYKLIPTELKEVVRLNMAYQNGPHDVLRAFERGSDLVCGDWITTATDAGLGFSFTLPTDDASVHDGHQKLDFAHNFIDNEKYASDLSPIAEGCECYTCTKHHRAYIAHLINANEMLAWTLLQIHNIHVANQFMSAIREAIKAGTFTTAATSFCHLYVEHISGVKLGAPRVRGYQVRLVGGTDKKLNEKAFRDLSADV
ncbi:hypothetical protein BZA70DRAFT_116211 [Myxozyma melibiosi]|uniref:tRNA-guanine(15) transglycosylase-like domain-containing protein n=1 Tax=Myxozyma melibiosi TaxID=54550 RepID=A0ABR1FCG6_9ASCO